MFVINSNLLYKVVALYSRTESLIVRTIEVCTYCSLTKLRLLGDS